MCLVSCGEQDDGNVVAYFEKDGTTFVNWALNSYNGNLRDTVGFPPYGDHSIDLEAVSGYGPDHNHMWYCGVVMPWTKSMCPCERTRFCIGCNM